MNIIFDLDGTLSDSGEGILRSIKYALVNLGAPVPPEPVLRRWVGPPLRACFASLLQTTDGRLIECAVTKYRDRFAAVGLYENRMYPGIEPMLCALSAAGHRLFVATSKPHIYANRILAFLAIDRHFSAVVGSEMDGKRSDKSELLAELLAQEGLSAEQCCMVGDRVFDIQGAARIGMPAIGVAWGYGGASELRVAGADRVCNQPAELIRLLSRSADASRRDIW